MRNACTTIGGTRPAQSRGERPQGDWTAWSDSFTDAAGEGTRTFQVRVTAVEPTGTAEPTGEQEALKLPSDLAAMRVTMDFQAAPDQVLFGCRMALLDRDGNRYVYRPMIGGVMQTMFPPCLQENLTGPQPSITAGEPRVALYGEKRPPQWTTRPVVLVPRTADITQVLLWWEQPDYLAVQVD